MAYHYQDGRRAEQSLRDVHQTLQKLAERSPFVRFSQVRDASDHSEGAVSAHLKELVRRRRAIQVGVQYVPVSALADMEPWQLKRIASRCSEEQAEAHRLRQRVEEKIVQFRQQLAELRDQDMMDQLATLEYRAEYLREKRQLNHLSIETVFQVMRVKVEATTQDKVEKSPQAADCFPISDSPMTALA